MLLEQFFQRIDASVIGGAVEKRRELLELTPGERLEERPKIYVENVRAFFGIPRRLAEALLNLGVRQGLFERCSGFLCPTDNRIIFEHCDEGVSAPESLHCEVCEALEREPSVFDAAKCRTMQFYRLREVDGSRSSAA